MKNMGLPKDFADCVFCSFKVIGDDVLLYFFFFFDKCTLVNLYPNFNIVFLQFIYVHTRTSFPVFSL